VSKRTTVTMIATGPEGTTFGVYRAVAQSNRALDVEHPSGGARGQRDGERDRHPPVVPRDGRTVRYARVAALEYPEEPFQAVLAVRARRSRAAVRCTDSYACRDRGCADCERSYGPRR
jgi:hypothetical protein